MIKIKKNSVSLLLFSLLLPLSASANVEQNIAHSSVPEIRLEHFNHLYKEIEIEQMPNKKQRMGIVHIYSEAPDYSYAIEPAEGFTCVDDVARAIIMLSQYEQLTNNVAEQAELSRKIKMMAEFVLHMQNENGYFNNFIWHDFSINTEYKTTVAQMNWWTFRALWSLQEALPLVKDDPLLSQRINQSIERVVVNLKKDLAHKDGALKTIEGMQIPDWLPNQHAADQAALAVISLLPYYQKHQDKDILNIINALSRGMMAMQKGDEQNYPYGMFLSWQNLWHSWGNSQAYALLLAGQQLNNQEYIDSALLEVNNFYPYLLENGFAEAIFIEKQGQQFKQIEKKAYPQIAYGIRPMVFAAAQAYEITKDDHYLQLLDELQAWLFGQNDAKTVMYNTDNGRIFDAVISDAAVNKNSGAESTVEGLMVLIKSKSLKVEKRAQ